MLGGAFVPREPTAHLTGTCAEPDIWQLTNNLKDSFLLNAICNGRSRRIKPVQPFGKANSSSKANAQHQVQKCQLKFHGCCDEDETKIATFRTPIWRGRFQVQAWRARVDCPALRESRMACRALRRFLVNISESAANQLCCASRKR